MRTLVVSNMLANDAHPERGRLVRDQVDALRTLDGVSVELYEFPPGAPERRLRLPMVARLFPRRARP